MPNYVVPDKYIERTCEQYVVNATSYLINTTKHPIKKDHITSIVHYNIFIHCQYYHHHTTLFNTKSSTSWHLVNIREHQTNTSIPSIQKIWINTKRYSLVLVKWLFNKGHLINTKEYLTNTNEHLMNTKGHLININTKECLINTKGHLTNTKEYLVPAG